MSFGVFIGCIILALSGTALVLFPDFRKKLKIMCGGFLNVFIEDKAKTPQGANAVFQQAISMAEEKYTKTHNLLQLRSGELKFAEDKLLETQKKLQELESSCERLVQHGKVKEATVLSMQRDELLIDINQQTKLIENLGPMVQECLEIANHNEHQLRQLKIKRKQIITQLETDKQMTDMYNDLDKLKKTKVIDKLLESVDDGYQDSRQKAIGAKVVHENKLETRVNKAQSELRNLDTNSYIDELIKKNKKD